MTTLDDLLNRGEAAASTRDAGRKLLSAFAAVLYRVGWLLAKLLYVVLIAIGGLFYSIGWIARRVLWPALVWCGAAVRLGWQDARRRGDS